MSCRKPLAALAAITAALAVAVPVTSASAATTPTVNPQVCSLLDAAQGPFGPTMFYGGSSLGAVLANTGASVNCPPPAPRPSLLPTGLLPTGP
jgi:hypothetical protein